MNGDLMDEETDIFDIMAKTSPAMQENLDVLNPEQLEATIHEGSPLLILAGAGSGKTRVITTKIAYLIAEQHIAPQSILAVTFTKKAATEMQERAVQIEPRAAHSQIRTFHSFGAWFLRLNADAAGISPNFTVYDDDDMVTLICKANPKLTKQQANHFAHKIALAKDYCFTTDDPRLVQIESEPEFRHIYSTYQARLKDTGNVDFGDLIMLPYLVLRDNEHIRHYMQNRFKVIMVDEYQDSNVAQFLLLQSLSGVNENSGTYVCVVGDDDQSIYKFRGAEIQNILTFKDKFPGTKLIRLERNYRSTAEILQIAGNVVNHNEGRLGKTLRAERGSGKKPVLAFLPNQDEEADFCANLIALSVKNGANYSDWAILYRTNAQSLTFETNFLHKKIPYQVVGALKFYEREEIKDLIAFLKLVANPRDEISFRRIINKPTRGIGAKTQDKIVETARSELLQTSETELAENNPAVSVKIENLAQTALLGLEPEQKDSKQEDVKGSLVKATRAEAQTMSKKAREGATAFVAIIDEALDLLSSTEKEQECTVIPENDKKNLSALIELLAENSGLKEYHAAQDEVTGTQRTLNMQELANSAVPFDCTMKGLLDFLDTIELDRTIAGKENQEDKNRVTLITIHNTKGLEFNRVIMTGMERGIFPRADKDAEELEEERRLCYVGMTRARNELYLTSCSMRRMYGRTEYMDASPFLLEAGAENMKVLGHAPSSFRRASFKGGDYGKNGLSHPDVETDPIKAKYKKGKRVYHDDYGYGIITRTAETDDGEYSITVTFENSGSKSFLPKYQSSSLLVTDE